MQRCTTETSLQLSCNQRLSRKTTRSHRQVLKLWKKKFQVKWQSSEPHNEVIWTQAQIKSTHKQDKVTQLIKCPNIVIELVCLSRPSQALSSSLSHSPSPSLSCRLSLCRANAAGGPHEQQLSLGFSPPFGYWPAAWWLALFQGTTRRSWVQIEPFCAESSCSPQT